jgi:prepilin-type processing-associated H-X9-DG protein
LYADANFFDFPVPRPSEVPVFCDAVWVDLFPDFNPLNVVTTMHPYTYSYGVQGAGGLQRASMMRHGLGINVAFCDGHAENLAWQKLWTLTWRPGWVTPSPIPTMPTN